MSAIGCRLIRPRRSCTTFSPIPAARPALRSHVEGQLVDPEWTKAMAESEKNGKLVSKVEFRFLHATDYSPVVKPAVAGEPRVFELRTYTCTPNNLKRLDARFRDHTIALFSKHGMEHFGYWQLDAGQKGADDTLIYMLMHKSKEAHDASFDAFRADPDWVKAREASEKEGKGSLTTPDGSQVGAVDTHRLFADQIARCRERRAWGNFVEPTVHDAIRYRVRLGGAWPTGAAR